MKTENSTEIKIWDLKDSNVYIKIKSPIREEFFVYLTKNSSYKKLGKKVGVTFSYLFQQKKGMYFLSMNLLDKLLDICSEDKKLEFRKRIENNVEEVKVRSRSSSIKNPRFPIRLTETLARIAGHSVGDGGINNSFIVHYTNENSELLDSFRKDILETFGKVKCGSYTHKNKEHIKTIWFPRIVGLLLAKMIGKQVKKYKHVPKIILESDNNLKSIFLGALFDDEGRVNVDAYTISIMMTGKKLIKDVKKLLEEIDISCGKISVIEPDEFSFGKKYKMRLKYQFYISGKISLKRFSELINFNHFRKKIDMKNLIQKYKTYKFEELKELVLEQLRLNSNGINAFEISEKLNRKSSGSFRQFLCKLEKKGMISSVKRNNLKTYVVK